MSQSNPPFSMCKILHHFIPRSNAGGPSMVPLKLMNWEDLISHFVGVAMTLLDRLSHTEAGRAALRERE